MAKSNAVQEPSVEEILASIRRIISDDERAESVPSPVDDMARYFEREAAPKPRPAPAPAAPAAVRPAEPRPPREPRGFFPEVVAGGESRDARIEPAAQDTQPHREARPETVARPVEPRVEAKSEPRAVSRQPVPRMEPVAPVPSPRVVAAAPAEPALMSPATDAAVASAFNHLASTILQSDARSLDELTRDMLKPMLKAWLDANLPPLVEKLVREEIERVARGRR